MRGQAYLRDESETAVDHKCIKSSFCCCPVGETRERPLGKVALIIPFPSQYSPYCLFKYFVKYFLLKIVLKIDFRTLKRGEGGLGIEMRRQAYLRDQSLETTLDA